MAFCRYTGIGIDSMFATKNVFKVRKNAWTSDLKQSNYVVCPEECLPLFKGDILCSFFGLIFYSWLLEEVYMLRFSKNLVVCSYS